jgi:sulfite exporter TauE/SafE
MTFVIKICENFGRKIENSIKDYYFFIKKNPINRKKKRVIVGLENSLLPCHRFPV